MSILNLTHHDATLEQLEAGVVEPSDKATVRNLLTFVDLPTLDELRQRAYKLAEYADMEGVKKAMIEAPSYLISLLEAELIAHNIQPVHSFYGRWTTEKLDVDGRILAGIVFKHMGFIEIDMF